VKLINTDGMAFIGPGSEWFWTAVSGLVLAVTFLAIYRQLRLQSSAGAIEQAAALARDWNSELLHRSRLAVLVALRDGVDRANTPQQATIEIGNHWERVGYLVRSGHIDRRIVYAYIGSIVRLWWALLTPNTLRLRELQRDAAIYEHFEWLAELVAGMDRSAGSMAPYDEATLVQRVQSGIQNSLDAIHAAEEIRAVLLRPVSPAAPTAPSAVAQEAVAPAAPPA
jgi:hypothetical protein